MGNFKALLCALGLYRHLPLTYQLKKSRNKRRKTKVAQTLRKHSANLKMDHGLGEKSPLLGTNIKFDLWQQRITIKNWSALLAIIQRPLLDLCMCAPL